MPGILMEQKRWINNWDILDMKLSNIYDTPDITGKDCLSILQSIS